jgi:hypothetical protein
VNELQKADRSGGAISDPCSNTESLSHAAPAERQHDLKFEIEGVSLDIREALSVWKLGIMRRVRQEEIRNRRGFNPHHAEKMRALRAEWTLYRQCCRLAAWGRT